MLIISSSTLFQGSMITGLGSCSRFNLALLRVHMITGLGLSGRFSMTLLRGFMLTDPGPCSKLLALLRRLVVTDVRQTFMT